MIRELTPQDQPAILDFAYQREKENLFVIGSFEFRPNPFEINDYLGYFINNELVGLGTYFGLWSDIQINAPRSSMPSSMNLSSATNPLNLSWPSNGMLYRRSNVYEHMVSNPNSSMKKPCIS